MKILPLIPLGSTFSQVLSTMAIAIFWLHSFAGHSQSREIDSLRSLKAQGITLNPSDSLYFISIELMRNGQFDLASSALNHLRSVGEETRDSLQIVRAIAIKAAILRRQGLLDSAMITYNAALAIARRKSYQEQVKNILNSLGLLYVLEARYDLALNCLFESLELRQKTADSYELSVVYHNIGLAYYKLEDYNKALLYYDKSLTFITKSKRSDPIDQLLLNIGWCYIKKKEYNQGSRYISYAHAQCKGACSDKFLIDAHLGLGQIARHQQKLVEAEKNFILSLSLAKKQNDLRQALENIGQLSAIYILQNKVQLAEKYLKEAEDLIRNDDRYRLELAIIYRQFSGLYAKTADLKRRVYFQEKYIALRDSIFNYQVTTNLMKAESEFVERESKARIDTQNKILKLNNEIIFRQHIANISFGLVALLGIILAVMFARRNKAKQLANKLLDQKVVERTLELRSNQELIQRTLEEKSILVHKTTSELHSLIATTKGLCSLGSQEMDISRCQEYWRRLDATTDGMRSTIAKLAESRKDIHAALMQS